MLEDANLGENQSSESTQTWATGFKLGSTKYATSLFWQPLRNPEDPYPEITEAAENVLEGSDLFALKKGKSPQFGLCISTQGYKKGTTAAAPTIVNALSDATSFLAVFKVDEGWWYVCVRNDVILPDGDMLFLNEQEAKDQFASMLVVPDWGYKIAPAEWQFENTTQQSLKDLFKDPVKSTLQKVNALRGPKLFIMIAAIAVAGLWLLSTLSSKVFVSAPPKPVVAPVAIQRAAKEAPPPEPKPWEKILDPAQILQSCFYGVQELVGISTPGWQIGGITCNPDGLVTSWHRQIGRLSWIDKALNNSGVVFSNKSISPNGNEVVASKPMPKIRQIKSVPKMNGVDLVNTINDLFQGIQMPISMSSQTWTSPQNNVYKSVRISFSSKHDPTVWSDILTKFSGLTINVVKYDTNNNSWYYEGAIYVL